jgi:hypothetical protein
LINARESFILGVVKDVPRGREDRWVGDQQTAVDDQGPVRSQVVSIDEAWRQLSRGEGRADERDRLADERDRLATQREEVANERERLADAREHDADERERLADERDQRFSASRGAGAAVRLGDEARWRARAALDRIARHLDREEAASGREEAGWRRDQSEVDREVCASRQLTDETQRELPTATATASASANGGVGRTLPVREDAGAVPRMERIAHGAHVAAQAAANRAAGARQRREVARCRLAALRDGGRGALRGATADERTAAAAEAIAAARAHAAAALGRSIEAHAMSALAHEHAAETADGTGDVATARRHRDAAVRARAAAEHDRCIARAARQSADIGSP